MPQITLEKLQDAKLPPKQAAPPKKSPPEKDPLTLAKLVIEAAADVRVLVKSDPHLKRMIKDLAACDFIDAEDSALEVDAYISHLVAKYLTNPARKPRMRFPVVKASAVCDMRTKKARCIIKVRAWGHTVRVCEDLALPA